MSTNLQAALNPKSIAVVGASDNPHKVGGRPILFMNKYGYKGRIFPINPSRAEVQGYKAYPDLASLPEVPDMAIVALAGEGTVQAVEQCARMGVKVAVILASGYGETGAEGKKIQDAMLAGRAPPACASSGPIRRGWPISAPAPSPASPPSSTTFPASPAPRPSSARAARCRN